MPTNSFEVYLIIVMVLALSLYYFMLKNYFNASGIDSMEEQFGILGVGVFYLALSVILVPITICFLILHCIAKAGAWYVNR